MIPVQFELNFPHVCLESDRLHLYGRGGGDRK